MSQNIKKQGWHSDLGRSGSSNMEHVDAFILNLSRNQEAAMRLFADPAWVTTCEEPDPAIFVRSSSECIDRKDREP